MTLLLDTHVCYWASSEPARLSRAARSAIDSSDELAVAAMTWCELAWLAGRGRITVPLPIRSWLDALARNLRTLPITPPIAATAASLPDAFPGDPADRMIFASAIEHGIPLVTKDGHLRKHRDPRVVTVW